jgi:hypothetical protein
MQLESEQSKRRQLLADAAKRRSAAAAVSSPSSVLSSNGGLDDDDDEESIGIETAVQRQRRWQAEHERTACTARTGCPIARMVAAHSANDEQPAVSVCQHSMDLRRKDVSDHIEDRMTEHLMWLMGITKRQDALITQLTNDLAAERQARTDAVLALQRQIASLQAGGGSGNVNTPKSSSSNGPAHHTYTRGELLYFRPHGYETVLPPTYPIDDFK